MFPVSHFQETNHSQTLVCVPQSIVCGYDKISSFLGGGGVCLIFLVVKLLAGFETFVPLVKDFTLDGASIVQMLIVVGVSIVQ